MRIYSLERKNEKKKKKSQRNLENSQSSLQAGCHVIYIAEIHISVSLTPALAAIVIFHHGFFHSPLSFVLRLFSHTPCSICRSFTFSSLSPLLLNRLLLSLIFPSPSLSLRQFSSSSLTPPRSHSFPLSFSLSLFPRWTQLLLTPRSHKTDKDRQKVRQRETERGRLVTEMRKTIGERRRERTQS